MNQPNDETPDDIEPIESQLLRRAASHLRAAAVLLAKHTANRFCDLVDEIDSTADEIDAWFEPNDPRSMGWVGDDGLP